MFWLNGQAAHSVSLSDRSFQYGDGCFTTILTRNGEPQLWSYHQQRMQACLRLLGIAEPDWQQVYAWLQAAAGSQPLAGLKLHISRGEGGRGYSPAQVNQANITISDFDYPAHYVQWQHDGVELGVCQQRLGLNPLTAGHKHNNRLEQVILRDEMDRAGHTDGVVLDIQNRVVETTMANLFWRQGDNWYTPDLEAAGVAGVMRRLVMELAAQNGIAIQLAQQPLEPLLAAEEVFMTNSILTVAPIVQIDNTRFPIGTTTRKFQELINS
ncbi:aminodeoxychorismate lyase [Vibrio sp.]|uniref:aminodeoxychorismate lyase n=1 Tax=Vibrio sp. TaxID=678 RepID=UPI003D104E47